jgi:branched-chain amino acid transport system ATP-binding protein
MTHGTDSRLLLTIENVSKAFGGVQALREVSLAVPQGEIRAIIGPNGAGKTTLINLISRVYPPDQGKIFFAGRDLTRLATHKIAVAGIGRTFQNIALFKGMTVLENLMLGRHPLMRPGLLSSGIYWGLAQKKEVEHRAKVEWIIDFLEITAIRKQVVGALPLGLQKRVELGRALALEPTLLLLDEPMAGMNVEEKEDMVRFIFDINEELSKTIVLIEHDMGVVMDISQRVSVLDFGVKIAEGSPEEIRTNAAVITAYLGTARKRSTSEVHLWKHRWRRCHSC